MDNTTVPSAMIEFEDAMSREGFAIAERNADGTAYLYNRDQMAWAAWRIAADRQLRAPVETAPALSEAQLSPEMQRVRFEDWYEDHTGNQMTRRKIAWLAYQFALSVTPDREQRPAALSEADPRDEFERKFPIPLNCVRCGTGYSATEYNAWDAHKHIDRWKGWSAALPSGADRERSITGEPVTGPCAGCDVFGGCPEYCHCAPSGHCAHGWIVGTSCQECPRGTAAPVTVEVAYCGPCGKPRDPNCATCGQWSKRAAPVTGEPVDDTQYRQAIGDLGRINLELRAKLDAKPVPERVRGVTLNGYQLKEALEFLAPDGDADQLESSLRIEWGPKRISTDGDEMEAGMYAWLDEYPEEGCIQLDEKPAAAPVTVEVAEPHVAGTAPASPELVAVISGGTVRLGRPVLKASGEQP